MSNNIRFIARITLEAKTGLFVGSGESSLLKDALVQRDHLGLPMIQGTSLAGVLRHSLEEASPNPIWDSIFGFQKGDKGNGSRLKISSAYLISENDEIIESLDCKIPDHITKHFENLPSRQHVRISDKGVAEKNGLFDNEVVYAGCKFKFEIELIGTEVDKNAWNNILNQMYQPNFRLGSGTRNGYGKLAVEKIETKTFDLTQKSDFESYLAFDPSLNTKLEGFETDFNSKQNISLVNYRLELKPDLFFMFSEGSGDDQVDNKPTTEEKMVYNADKTISFVNHTLVPGSSIKGAIRHRVAFHYNKLLKRWADPGNDRDGKNNEAVFALFGIESKGETGQRGNIMIDDIYFNESEVNNDKIFNHVAIDRFTGGAMDGALFSEKVSQLIENDIVFEINLSLNKSEFNDENINHAFEAALIDICKGLLPLGGMTTKGNGMFTGKLFKNETEIYNYGA
ncbi:RAMP superfamily CRISPR-associated protein [Lacihabitans lacunae]|uniref:RAMP superfamily CRISPR-associated protein n=1 Tax=Lacihabitans lacunae TaxID=1028214 RepID=A0ABV7YQZ2_9BACT